MPRLALLLLAFVAFSPLAPSDEKPLAARLEELMDGPQYRESQWGLLVVDSKTGETVYARNPEKLFIPASVTKLYTCSGMMLAYGAEHRFQTPVYLLGSQKDGVAKGNLILVAQGDPMFGSRYGPKGEIQFRDHDHTYFGGTGDLADLTETDPRYAFDDLAKQLKAAGLKSLDGDVLIDDRLFQTTRATGSGPDSVSPVIINDNLIDVIITPGKKVGDAAQVKVRPDTGYFRTDISITTGEKDTTSLVRVVSSDADSLILRGQIAVDRKPMVRTVVIKDVKGLARAMLIEALLRQGIQVSASRFSPTEATLPEKSAYKELKPLAQHTSAPVSELLKVTLKVSHNLYATTLPLLIGAKMGLRTESLGLQEEGRLLKKLGVPIERISLGSGAGGGNADRVTPAATVTLLQQLQKRDDWPAFKAALPILGVDGTLAKMIDTKSPAKGKVFAKTGTLVWSDGLNGRNLLTSKALAGVMTTKSGRELTFAMFVNNVPLPISVPTSREGKQLARLTELIYLHCPDAK